MSTKSCCELQDVERLRNVDLLLATYKGKGMEVVKGMFNGSSFDSCRLWGEILPSDGECIAGLGIEGRVPTCLHCCCLQRLCSLSDGATLEVETGIERGSCYKLKYLKPPTSSRNEPELRHLSVKVMESEEPSNYVGMDETSLRVLWSFISRAASSHALGSIMAYRCRSKVVIVEPCSVSLSTIYRDLSQQQWKRLFSSLVSLFYGLIPYQVVWTYPSLLNLGIEQEWENNEWWPRVSLGGCVPSFATGDWRVVPLSTIEAPCIHRWREWVSYFERCRWMEEVDYGRKNEVELYCIDGVCEPMFTAFRHAGIPLKSGSFEIYCVMAGMCCVEEARGALISTLGPEKWKGLWPGEGHSELLEGRCGSMKGSLPSYHEVVKLLEGLWLRNDVLPLLVPSVFPE